MSTEAPTLAAIAPAAGRSQRLGQAKQLLRIEGQTLITRCVENLQRVCDPVYAVLGAQAETVLEELPLGSTALYNPDWQLGLGSSLACGVAALPAGCSGVLVALPDQPQVQAQQFARLIRLWRRDPQRIVCARYAGITGVPAILPRRLFPRLRRLNDDRGARALIAADARVGRVALPEAALDIDTVADIARSGLCFDR